MPPSPWEAWRPVLGEFPTVSCDHLKKLLEQTGSRAPSDPCLTKVLYERADFLAPSLVLLFNNVLKFKCFGVEKKSLLKKFTLAPYDETNYHPISRLPILAKVLERHLNISSSTYLDQNDTLDTVQFGFRMPTSPNLSW